MAGSTLPDRVAQLYYTYGLFCSSNPFFAIALASSVLLFCCYPLLNVPLPGNTPTVVSLPWNIDNFQNVPHSDSTTRDCTQNKDTSIPLHSLLNDTKMPSYLWTKDKPLLYTQQIIMKIGVSPWNSNLKMWDAFRAPLHEAFRLLEAIRNHEEPETKSTLAHHCYQIESIKRRNSKAGVERVFPEYSCLLLSPANLWQQNIQSFSLDANIVNTVLKYQKSMPLAEMAFGMQMRDTGIKRYPLRARPRVLQYAITIFYRNSDERFIQSLTKKLKEMYPLYQDSYTRIDDLTLIYYPGQFNYTNLIPLLFIFVGVLYVYFSVRKIEFIKSKFGLAACAGLTIAGSLFMSMGICFYFGFSLGHKGGETLPYLVIILGYENVLVLTKSVTSTDSQLDVKIRLAQGLSKEGWSITKNLLIEITILTLSFFTFVPLIQELAIFMIVSLVSDYFIQMVFFATILGIDVRRMEFFQQPDKQIYLKDYFNPYNESSQSDYDFVDDNSYSSLRMRKSKSHPRLNGLAQNSPADVLANRNGVPTHLEARVPKRIRLVNIWARTRFFQRLFMLWMLVWISMIVYNSGVVDYFITNTDKVDNAEVPEKREQKIESKQPLFSLYYNSTQALYTALPDLSETNDTIALKHSPHSRPWSRLSAYHWSGILSQYNASVLGRYVVVLPPVLLSQRVAPELAAGLRHPDERDPPPLRWQALAAALDPIDIITDFELIESKSQQKQWGSAAELPIYPTTPMEILLLAILCVISVAVIAYMMVVLYRFVCYIECVCSRHYAEWRASWSEDDEYKRIIAKQPAVQLVMEAVPLVVTGHVQEVECLVTDGEKVVSACLQGNVKVWDSQNGDLLTNIDRYELFNEDKEPLSDTSKKSVSSEENEETTLNTSSHHNESLPILRKNLSDHLSGLRHRPGSQPAPAHLPDSEITNYSFANTYKELYCNEDISESKENVDTNNISLGQHAEGPMNDSQLDDSIILLPREDNVNNRLGYSSKRRVASDSSIEEGNNAVDDSNENTSGLGFSPVWCMDFTNDLIIIGCADGRIEFWDAVSGKLKCVWWSCGEGASGGVGGSGGGGGVTHVRVVGAGGARCVCAATLSGRLALLQLHASRFRGAHRRAHKRTGSAGSLQSRHDPANFMHRWSDAANSDKQLADSDEVVCVQIALCRPYQQPITELHSEGERILTGGQDHTLKVFSSRNLGALLTLHGHCGPITSCFIDRATPTIAGSGSQDGLLCVWDLHTGACLYSTQAHNGAVSALAYSASYVVSAGADERLCIWDRFQGNKLKSVPIGLNYMSRMLPLTHTMLVIGDRGGLTVYDLSSGDVIRRVLFGESDSCIFVRQVLPLNDAIVCDYANQLRIVRFPLISQHLSTKSD